MHSTLLARLDVNWKSLVLKQRKTSRRAVARRITRAQKVSGMADRQKSQH
jgi:hypothetical protein